MKRLKIGLVALASGLLFGAGLTWSEIASPSRVLAFLTLGPAWDPRLAFVMAGALAISVPGFWWLRRKGRPWLGDSFAAPPTRSIDARLLGGAALFGIGWGLVGLCPGPAIVGAGFLQGTALLFLPAMLLGAIVARR